MNVSDKEVIQQVLHGVSTPSHARQVAEWFASAEGRKHLSDLIDEDINLKESGNGLPEMITPVQSDKIFNGIRQILSKKRMRVLTLRVAAVLLPLVILLGMGFYLGEQAGLTRKSVLTELYVPKGERARLHFQDGTEVALNSDSEIGYPRRFGLRKRDVYLRGEAYFKVSPDKYRPFVIHAGNTSIRVLGTSFNVNAYEGSDKLRVSLDEGEVLFSASGTQVHILPGQELVYDTNTGAHEINAFKSAGAQPLWQKNIIALNGAPLKEVLQILERTYAVSFDVKNEEAYLYSYTIDIQNTSLSRTLKELEMIAPVRFKLQNAETVAVVVAPR